MFKKGDKVVYPQHGAGVVERIEEKEVLEKKAMYYNLAFSQGLKVMLPTGAEEQIGMRGIVDETVGAEVLTYLGGKKSRMPKDWNRRFKKNKEKIRTGDIFEVADVVKNLSIRESENGLSSAEKRMLMRAKKILLSELVFALDESEENLTGQLDKIFQ